MWLLLNVSLWLSVSVVDVDLGKYNIYFWQYESLPMWLSKSVHGLIGLCFSAYVMATRIVLMRFHRTLLVLLNR